MNTPEDLRATVRLVAELEEQVPEQTIGQEQRPGDLVPEEPVPETYWQEWAIAQGYIQENDDQVDISEEDHGADAPDQSYDWVCDICAEDLGEIQSVCLEECGHHLCERCVRTLFEHAIEHEVNWPPRCCQDPIHMDAVWELLTPGLVEQVFAKDFEWSTQDRTYCPNEKCSTFLRPDTITDRKAICPACEKSTCATCKRPFHEDGACNLQDDQELMDKAAEQGWQRCPGCRRLIEIDDGCNHMTCHCGTQFCYECAAPWKTCACEQWRGEQLQEPAGHYAWDAE